MGKSKGLFALMWYSLCDDFSGFLVFRLVLLSISLSEYFAVLDIRPSWY